jgi:hypothetical protein
LEHFQKVDSYVVAAFLVWENLPQSGNRIALTKCERERKALMKKPKRNWHVTVVDVVVGLAVLMILSALVVPIFIPPEGRAASRVAAPSTSAMPAQH